MSHHSNPIPEWLNKQYMEDILKQVFDRNLTVKRCDISAGSTLGDNYLCQIFRIGVTLQKGVNADFLSIIGKYNPENKIMIEITKENLDVHTTECDFLSETASELQAYHNNLNLHIFPKCYYSDEKRKIIFMEDLRVKNFELIPRHMFLDLDHCFQTVQAHATFHASSYLLMQTNPQSVTKYDKTMWKKDMPEFAWKFVDNSFTGIEKNVDNWKLSDKQKLQLEKLRAKLGNEGFQICEFQEHCFNVLIHGDCWKNNMMFRYHDNQVVNVCLLDFQLVNYNCFALDLQYFLSSSATQEVRYGKIDEILTFYYDCFCKVAPNVPEFNLERVKKEFYEKEFLGFTMAVLFRPMVIAEKGMDTDKIMDGHEDFTMFDQRCGDELKKALDFYGYLLE